MNSAPSNLPIPEQLRRTPAFPGQIMPGMPGYCTCTRCVMDTTHLEIEFDASGICNYCKGYDQILKNLPPPAKQREILEQLLDRIRSNGVGRDYDCILGVSGGVDSSYLALKCKDWGLRPLLVQFDNGWNTELANHNIQAICQHLGFELYTYVVDWPEFRDLQLAFIRAGVANIEAPSDHGIFACIYRAAHQKRIGWLLTGVNYVTEACDPIGEMARRVFSYGYSYGDLYHLRALHRRFGRRPLRTFPTLSSVRRRAYELSGQLKRFDPLNYMPYNKAEAVAMLQERVGWRPYPRKHFESVITRFHQSYFLPVKFGMDKRRLHLSGLIWSGQLTRDQGLQELSEPICPPELLAQDLEFVMKKLGLDQTELNRLMAETPHSYHDYPNSLWFETLLGRGLRLAGRLRRRLRGGA
jgi:N-acetyl sugar amidotransferase